MTKKCEFKSAKDLGLKQKEWEALITTLILMEHNAIVHVPEKYLGLYTEEYHKDRKVKATDHIVFNMNDWQAQRTCGSVCCIGGSAEFFGKLPRSAMEIAAMRLSDNDNENLYDLFYSWKGDPTPKQAARVLRNYLETGVTNWNKMHG